MSVDMVTSARKISAEALLVAVAGALSLAIAMGIGRFAFTPLLPMMLHDGVIDLQAGSLLATSNYLGYLAGALLCMAMPRLFARMGRPLPDSARLVRFALLMTGVLTLAMSIRSPGLWPVWRALAGVISAVGFVYTSGWCLARLAALGRGELGGVIYTGPGIGIAISGLGAFAMTAGGAGWASGWLVFGGAAIVLAALIWPVFAPGLLASSRRDRTEFAVPTRWSAEEGLLVLAYGLAGLGYIVTATFLPVIARSALPGSSLVDLFWPLFGTAVAAGALLTRLVPAGADRRLLLAACYVLQGIGVLSSLLVPTATGFMAGSILLGLPFTVITLFSMQEVRRLRPYEPTGFMGLMTAAYGIGQIAGPLLVAAVLARVDGPEQGFAISLAIAAFSLFAGALVFLV